jgi:hypothetical protein
MFNQTRGSIIGEYQSMSTNDQIQYLQEENQFLKELISQTRTHEVQQQRRSSTSADNNTECSFCFTTQKQIENNGTTAYNNNPNLHANQQNKCKCEVKYRDLLQTYEGFLDSLIMQLLNSLQMQESIRMELLSISEKNAKLKQVATMKNPASDCSDCRTVIERCGSPVQNQRINNKSSEGKNINKENKFFDESLESVYKFQALLDEQQNQQLKMLNDLCLISKLVKVCTVCFLSFYQI